MLWKYTSLIRGLFRGLTKFDCTVNQTTQQKLHSGLSSTSVTQIQFDIGPNELSAYKNPFVFQSSAIDFPNQEGQHVASSAFIWTFGIREKLDYTENFFLKFKRMLKLKKHCCNDTVLFKILWVNFYERFSNLHYFVFVLYNSFCHFYSRHQTGLILF